MKMRSGPIGFAALVAAVVLVPHAAGSFRTFELAYVGLYFIAVLGLNILTGYTGQISLGHGAFMAIGGYTSAILATDHGVPTLWTIPIAGLVAGFAGLLFGIPALRLSGLYLALVTFGIAVAMPAILKWDEVKRWTGGNTGKILPLPKAHFGLGVNSNDWLFYQNWAIALVLLAAAWLLVRGRLGRAWRAIRDSEVAAASSGVNLALYKTLAFGISAFYAGIAGSLLALTIAFVSPDTYPIKLSVFVVVGAVVAGLGSLWGIVVGAALVQFLGTGDVEKWVHVSKSVPPDVFFGGVLVLVIVLLPRGAAGLGHRLTVLGSSLVKRRLTLPASLAGFAALAAVALAGSTATPGVTDTTILLGGTAPLSGEASSAAAVAKGAEAYFKYVNDRGGVLGRKIDYTYLDDAYDPARTVQDVRQLVQQSNVFAMFNTLGTNQNLAIRDFLNQSGVPQLFVASGANTWGADYKKYPWTVGYIPSYMTEAIVYGHYILKLRPKAKIAVLFQDDAYGHDLVDGLKKGLAGGKAKIVGSVGYDPTTPDVNSQVAQLKATKADTFMIFAFGKFAVQALIQTAKLGWHPQVFVNAVASSANLMALANLAGARAVTRGAISIVYFKDPTDPRWAKDRGILLDASILKKYVPGGNAKDGYYVAGMASAFTMVDALKKAGKNLTRAGIIKAALSLNEANNPFVVPGIVVRTSPTDHYPIDQVGLERWMGTHWSIFGGLATAKG